MNPDVPLKQATEIRPFAAYQRSLYLLALIGMNGLLLAATFRPMFWSLQHYGSVWLAIGVLYTQVYLLSFWGAFRGGSLVLRLGAPILVVVFGGYLAVELSTGVLHLWPPQFAVLPIPLLIAYWAGLGLLLPVRWWSGKTLVFPGEDPPSGRPHQFRIHHIAVWTLLVGVTLGLARVATAADIPQADLQLVLLGPVMLGFVALLSIPLVRGVFASSRAVMWSVCGLLFVLGAALLVGGVELTLLWQTYGRRWRWFDYTHTLIVILVFHGLVGLTLLGNLVAIRCLGGRFAARAKPADLPLVNAEAQKA